MQPWRYLDCGPASGADNMARDERLLHDAARGGTSPVLRVYAWDPPAVSLGRFQDGATAVNREACRRRGIEIVRRITGGRAVLHHRELTYCIVSPSGTALFPDEVIGAYKVIAKGLVTGLRRLGVPAEMVARSGLHAGLVRKNDRDPSCFSSPSWYELVVHGKKIVGSAQRREPGAFLQHGSILIGHDADLEADVFPGGGRGGTATFLERELGRQVSPDEVKEALRRGFMEALGIRFVD